MGIRRKGGERMSALVLRPLRREGSDRVAAPEGGIAEVKPLKPEGRERGRGRGEEIGFGTLARDRLPVRSLREEDLAAVVRIDRKLTGFDRSAYYAAKFREVLVESGIRVSLVAEEDGIVNGFIMARVDFGEFGQVETSAVIDTIGA